MRKHMLMLMGWTLIHNFIERPVHGYGLSFSTAEMDFEADHNTLNFVRGGQNPCPTKFVDGESK
jgi:hypothetical protein